MFLVYGQYLIFYNVLFMKVTPCDLSNSRLIESDVDASIYCVVLTPVTEAFRGILNLVFPEATIFLLVCKIYCCSC